MPFTRKRTWELPTSTASTFVERPWPSRSLIASCAVQSTTVGVSSPIRFLMRYSPPCRMLIRPREIGPAEDQTVGVRVSRRLGLRETMGNIRPAPLT